LSLPLWIKLSRFIEAQGGRDEAAVGERCPDGRQEVGSEPGLNLTSAFSKLDADLMRVRGRV